MKKNKTKYIYHNYLKDRLFITTKDFGHAGLAPIFASKYLYHYQGQFVWDLEQRLYRTIGALIQIHTNLIMSHSNIIRHLWDIKGYWHFIFLACHRTKQNIRPSTVERRPLHESLVTMCAIVSNALLLFLRCSQLTWRVALRCVDRFVVSIRELFVHNSLRFDEQCCLLIAASTYQFFPLSQLHPSSADFHIPDFITKRKPTL